MFIFDRDTWQEVAETIGRNKRRSIVTAFGVFWGLFMLIVLLSISSGFKNGVSYMTSSLAPNVIIVDQNATSLPYDGLPAGRLWAMAPRDLKTMQQHFPQVDKVSGAIYEWSAQTSYQTHSIDTELVGVLPNYFDIFRVKLLAGRLLRESDHEAERKFVLIGTEVAERLFKSNEAAIGKVIYTYGMYCTVVGVIDPLNKMLSIGIYIPEAVIMPYSVLSRRRGKGDNLHISLLNLREGVEHSSTKEEIAQFIKSRKRISPKDQKAVSFWDIDEMIDSISSINRGIDLLVWVVGIGTLLTGIVGISNILLVTVRERTQEIGVRRAIGAKPSNIIGQLLMESLSLTLLSGMLGIILGVGIMSLVANAFDGSGGTSLFRNPVVDLGIVFVALVILVISGILAGLIPALKAIEIQAIEAIREE